MSVRVIHSDARLAIDLLDDASIDSVVTDPPYALVSIVKRFANSPRNERTENVGNPYGRTGRGFMGKRWDTGETAFDPAFWADVLRVLKPGGHVVAFGGTRTYHRLACAIEDAGFEIRDQIGWLYGSGFPKSHDVSKGIDRAAGATREVIAEGAPVKRMIPGADQNSSGSWIKDDGRVYVPQETRAVTVEARAWEGWGTALKPAWEPIVLARKPLIGTVVENVLAHGTGAINIDGCRIETIENLNGGAYSAGGGRHSLAGDERFGAAQGMFQPGKTTEREYEQPTGRWPANIVHDGSDEVVAAFPQSKSQRAVVTSKPGAVSVNGAGLPSHTGEYGFNDSGSAARFFYSAKASKADRAGSKHPTVKPVNLMQWLCRLVTPPGGMVLDPFAGSGTTGAAAIAEGFKAILIEREAEYVADIRRRLELEREDIFA